MTTPTPADRLALIIYSAGNIFPADTPTCPSPCRHCRHISEAHARELAAILRERHGGSSTTADCLEAIGEHPPTTETP